MSIIYHIMSRGVDKRVIFQENRDYLRFIHGLFEFNDARSKNNIGFHFQHQPKTIDIASRYIDSSQRNLLVNLHAFCLMPNHYHLLASPIKENGIVTFMKKLNIGYAKYFNIKYDRKGTLFESRYKSVVVEDEPHFVHIPYYIHCNPLDLMAPEWRERKLVDPSETMKFLENYPWSSHRDYLGKENFPFVTQRQLLL